MRKQSFIAVFIVAVASGLSLTSCSQSENAETTAQDVEVDARELIDTLGQFTANQRDEAIEKARQALENVDSQVSELEQRIDRNWDTMSEEARQQARENLSRLRERRGELGEWYDDFKSSSAGAWDGMREGFTDAYQRLSDSWVNTRREFETDTE